jgi:hypothetical protein
MNPLTDLQRWERRAEWPLAAAERVAEEETEIQAANVAHIEELRSEIRELSQQLRERG